MKTLLNIGKAVKYDSPAYLFKQGEDPSHVYYLQNGSVALIKEAERDSEAIDRLLDYAHYNCYIGIKELLAGSNYKKSAVVAKNTRVIQIEKAAFIKKIEEDASLKMNLLQSLSKEIMLLHQNIV